MKPLIVALILMLVASDVLAQELPPPPPPPDVGSTETATEATDDVEAEDETGEVETADVGLRISTPIAGSEIGVATVVEGTAPPGAEIEVRVDGEIEHRAKVDQTGRFKVAVSGLKPMSRTRIEVVQLDAAGEIVSQASVVARTGAAPPPPPENANVDEVPDPAPPPPERSPVVKEKPDRVPQQNVTKAPVSQVARGFISTAVGVGSGFVGAVVGLLVGGMMTLVSLPTQGEDALIYLIVGMLAGYGIALPAGVYLTSYLLDGDGSLVLTVLACLAGIVGGAFLAASLGDDAGTIAFFAMSAVGAGAGALVFELTSNPSRKAAQMQGVSVTPILGPSPDGKGVVLGIGGRF